MHHPPGEDVAELAEFLALKCPALFGEQGQPWTRHISDRRVRPTTLPIPVVEVEA